MSRNSYWLKNGVFVTQDRKRRILRGNCRIENGRIVELGNGKPKRDASVIDLKGRVVMPGFIQTHVHLCQTLFRNQADDLELLDWLSKKIWIMEAAHTDETLYVSACLGIQELLSTGTTCLLDMGTVRHTDAIFEAVKHSGIRANVGKCLMDHPETTPKQLRDRTLEALLEAERLFERWNGTEGDRIRASFAPRFVVSCTEKLLLEVRQLSLQKKAIVHTHASENLKEIQLVKRLVNCENVEYLHQLGLANERLVLAHCIWLRPNEMSILKRTKTNVAHCPSSNLKLASGIARVPEMLKRGINVSLGADGAPCNNNLNMFQEMRLAALIHKPGSGPRTLRAQEALDLATLNGAQALGWSKDIGSIEVGKKADLICLDLERPETLAPGIALGSKLQPESIVSSIVYSAGPQNLEWSMVDGKILYKRDSARSGREKLLELVKRAYARIESRI